MTPKLFKIKYLLALNILVFSRRSVKKFSPRRNTSLSAARWVSCLLENPPVSCSLDFFPPRPSEKPSVDMLETAAVTSSCWIRSMCFKAVIFPTALLKCGSLFTEESDCLRPRVTAEVPDVGLGLFSVDDFVAVSSEPSIGCPLTSTGTSPVWSVELTALQRRLGLQDTCHWPAGGDLPSRWSPGGGGRSCAADVRFHRARWWGESRRAALSFMEFPH